MTYVVPEDCVVGDEVRELVFLNVVGKRRLLNTALRHFADADRRQGWIYPRWVWERIVKLAARRSVLRSEIDDFARESGIDRTSLKVRISQVRHGACEVPLCYREELSA